MKKTLNFLIAGCILLFTASSSFADEPYSRNLTSDIPEINIAETYGLQKINDVAQYKNADWNNVVGIAKNISVNEACHIASQNPDITFFFYTKGYQMVLETTDGNYRLFNHGDTVFFSGTPWWGSAPQLADGYVKQNSNP